MKGPIVEHVAIRARDFRVVSEFLQEHDGHGDHADRPQEGGDNLKQVWIGNIQLQRDETYDPAKASTGQMTHIGLVAENVEALLERVYAVDGVTQAEGKPRNWFELPDGPIIEVNEA